MNPHEAAEESAYWSRQHDAHFDEGARLATATRRALAHRHALEGSGVPVPTAARVEATEAVDAAQRAEAAYWEDVAQRARDKAAREREERIAHIMGALDAHNAHIDFEPGYRTIYGYFTKISEARAALLVVRAVVPAATMTVDGTKATITIAMGGEG